jgi:putative transposon-encoded protein
MVAKPPMDEIAQIKEPKLELLPSSIINVQSKVKFEVYGEEMLEKEVKQSGNSGRVYLPPEWVGKHVKIIRIE